MSTRGLTKAVVEGIAKPGVYCDRNGLYLQVKGENSKSWVYRYRLDKRSHSLGLGSAFVVTLDQARAKAHALRIQTHNARDVDIQGPDPLAARRFKQAERKQVAAPAAVVMTFKRCAELYIADNEGSWKSAKSSAQWTASLAAYAYPTIGSTDVAKIDSTHITALLKPIWLEKKETASRVRGRIQTILSYAKSHKWRDGDNPAALNGNLAHSLPNRPKAEAKHFAALPYKELPAFIAELGKRDGIAARAVAFTVLTAARSGEVRGALWSEIDLDAAEWRIPASRMKSGKPHAVPLSDAAMALLRQPIVGRQQGSQLIFNGMKANSVLSDMSLSSVLKRMGVAVTVHGFRSSFRDWAAECTSYPNDVIELCLAHTIGNKVSQAYMRTTLPLQRKALLDEWGAYCSAIP